MRPEPVLALFIPLVAIVMGVAIGGWAIYLGYRKRRDIYTLYHQERLAAIEKGIELPPLPEAFFVDDAKQTTPAAASHRHLLKGLIFSLGGLAAFGALYLSGEHDGAFYAFVPIAVGLAFLIYYFAVARRQALIMDRALEAKLSQPDSLKFG